MLLTIIYKPISVLSVISNVFENVICDQLCEYFSSKNLLCSQLYGFWKKLSSELVAIEVIVTRYKIQKKIQDTRYKTLFKLGMVI